MVENGEISSDESKATSSFSNFFKNVIHLLDIKTIEYSNQNYGLESPVEIAIKKFEQHSSISLIKENIKNNESFPFLQTEQESILKEIAILDNKRNGTFKNIYTGRLKNESDICRLILENICKEEILLNKNFSKNLKLADVSTNFKKKDKTFVENYRPASVLSTVSKIFERIMQKHISDLIGKFMNYYSDRYSKHRFVFRHRFEKRSYYP